MKLTAIQERDEISSTFFYLRDVCPLSLSLSLSDLSLFSALLVCKLLSLDVGTRGNERERERERDGTQREKRGNGEGKA